MFKNSASTIGVMKVFSTTLLAAASFLVIAGCNGATTANATTAGEEPAPAAAPTLIEEPPVDLSNLKTEPEEGDQVAVLETERGTIVLMFHPEVAPRHVENFINLANAGFYDGTRFHRCIEGFMIQGGDPNSRDLSQAALWGTGGNTDESGNPINIEAEFSELSHERGVLSMARSNNPNSASSQFFIMHQDSEFLDGQYSAFGRVVSGIEVVDAIVTTGDAANNGAVAPNNAVVLTRVRIETWPLSNDN